MGGAAVTAAVRELAMAANALSLAQASRRAAGVDGAAVARVKAALDRLGPADLPEAARHLRDEAARVVEGARGPEALSAALVAWAAWERRQQPAWSPDLAPQTGVSDGEGAEPWWSR